MSKEKIKTNNRLKIAVIVLAIALIAAVGGIFGVYAATQQNVKTSFSVQYSIGKNVAVGLNVGAFDGGGNVITYFESDSSILEETDVGPLYKVGINDDDRNLSFTLPEDYNGVVDLDDSYMSSWYCTDIRFYMQNLSDKAMNVQFTDNSTIEGDLQVMYIAGKVTQVGLTDFEAPPSRPTGSFQVPAGELWCLIVSIQSGQNFDVNKSASYISTAENGLSFKFEQA